MISSTLDRLSSMRISCPKREGHSNKYELCLNFKTNNLNHISVRRIYSVKPVDLRQRELFGTECDLHFIILFFTLPILVIEEFVPGGLSIGVLVLLGRSFATDHIVIFVLHIGTHNIFKECREVFFDLNETCLLDLSSLTHAFSNYLSIILSEYVLKTRRSLQIKSDYKSEGRLRLVLPRCSCEKLKNNTQALKVAIGVQTAFSCTYGHVL